MNPTVDILASEISHPLHALRTLWRHAPQRRNDRDLQSESGVEHGRPLAAGYAAAGLAVPHQSQEKLVFGCVDSEARTEEPRQCGAL